MLGNEEVFDNCAESLLLKLDTDTELAFFAVLVFEKLTLLVELWLVEGFLSLGFYSLALCLVAAYAL